MAEIIKVGMADLNICSSPDAITTLGLGSCVGVVLYDSVLKICGMVHVMLPDSTAVRNNSNIAKFADTGIKELLRQLEIKGVSRMRLKSKIAGTDSYINDLYFWAGVAGHRYSTGDQMRQPAGDGAGDPARRADRRVLLPGKRHQ